MHPWKVKWAADAQEQLADLWLRSADRGLLTIASDHLDQILARDPRDPGKEASEGLWKIIVSPLVALFEIDDQNHVVIVTALGLITKN